MKAYKYHSRDEFLNDVELIYNNSCQYNGRDSAITKTAHAILQVARDCILEVLRLCSTLHMYGRWDSFQEEALIALEENIKATQEAAMDAADSESVVTSVTGGNLDGEF